MEGYISGDGGAGREHKMKVEYQPNSHRSKEAPPEREPIEKVVTGKVETRKRGLASRMAHTLIAEDSGSVWEYVLMDVLIPAAKNMLVDSVNKGLDRVVYGSARPQQASGRSAYTSYNKVSSDPRPALSRQARTTHDFREIIYETRGEAEDVLDRLRELISQYTTATVADLYDLAGYTGEFTDDKWGWTDLRSAQVRMIRGGYIISLPKTQPIAASN